MSVATMTSRKKPGFQLPTVKLKSSSIGGMKAQIQGAGWSEASTARVLANTPSLKSLYEFLASPKP